MYNMFSLPELNGKKEDDNISHERKNHKFFEVPCCRNKCVPKTNLNSCDVNASLIFKFSNIWRNKFQDKFSTP